MKTQALGIGYCMPERVLSNLDLEKMVETSDAWIVERTGISERRIVSPGEKNSDISIIAAQRALDQAGIDASQLDLIIMATVTPDMQFPATACLVQAGLGAMNAGAFDLAAGCTGFVYGLSVAEKYLMSTEYNYVLVVGCDIVSSVIDYNDRSTGILFGDGAGAMVLGKSDGECGLLSTTIGADGTGAGLLYMPGGGSAIPATKESVEQRLHYLRMNGNEIFKFATKIVAKITAELLEKANLTYADIDLFVPHQANLRIIQSAMKRMKLPPEKVAMNLDHYGNISAGSIPVALAEYNEKHPLPKGANILMVAFGTGLTYGGAILKWGRD